ncbi:hypothetical protein IK110_01890 [Candidatus Saccharibacteria bacterium]|nr:hypothetical protein [Candidatus Saccharibacteria bacterium]
MEENNQPTTAPEVKAAEKPKKCKHIPIIAILIILFAGSLAFGIVELALNLQKKADNCKAIDNSTSANNDTRQSPRTDVRVFDDSILDDISKNSADDNPNNNTGTKVDNTLSITIEADYDTKMLKQCSEDDCMDGVGYHNFALGDELGANYSGEKKIFLIRSDGNFSGVVLDKKVEKNYKINGKIKQAMVGLFGNGGYEAILILKTDGTVAAISLDSETSEFVLNEKLSGISNIVALRDGINGDGGEVFAVDANGNGKALSDYIWEVDAKTGYYKPRK